MNAVQVDQVIELFLAPVLNPRFSNLSKLFFHVWSTLRSASDSQGEKYANRTSSHACNPRQSSVCDGDVRMGPCELGKTQHGG